MGSDGEYHNEGGFSKAVAVNGSNAADDAGKRDNGNSRHNRAHVFKPVFFMQQYIGGRTDNHRQQGNEQHKFEHTPAVHFDGLSDQISHPQRRHHRRKDGGDGGHTD